MTTVHKKASKAIAFTVALRLPFAGTAVALVLIALTIVAAPTGIAGAREIGAQAGQLRNWEAALLCREILWAYMTSVWRCMTIPRTRGV